MPSLLQSLESAKKCDQGEDSGHRKLLGAVLIKLLIIAFTRAIKLKDLTLNQLQAC
jgi:hypothetical protein